MNGDRIAVWIRDHGQPANRAGEWLENEADFFLFEMSNCGVEVLDFESDARSARTWQPLIPRHVADREYVRPNLVLDPRLALVLELRCRREAQHAFVKGAGASDIRHRISHE